MNVIEFEFDEYSELVGVNISKCGNNYEEDKNNWIKEYNDMDDDDRYDKMEEFEDGWRVDYGWGNYSVSLEIKDDVRYVYLRMMNDGSIDGYSFGDEEIKNNDGYEEYGDKGVYYKEIKELESEMDYDLMIDVKELENYNMRDFERLLGY